MRLTTIALFMFVVVATVASFAVSASTPSKDEIPAYVTRAIDNPARAAERVNDIRRQMAAVMTFSRVKPGDKVLELVPGTGYWTRVFSVIAGSGGHVYTVWPKQMLRFSEKSLDNWKELVKKPPYTNVSLLVQPAADLSVPEPVDLVFTCQNYHDYHDPFMGPVNMKVFDKKVYDALKPGGYFVVIDHVAPAGSGISDTNTLHRIDPAVVRKEVESAGFVFDGSSNALRNPRDPHNIKVFNKAIRGHTDQFIYRFRKPLK